MDEKQCLKQLSEFVKNTKQDKFLCHLYGADPLKIMLGGVTIGFNFITGSAIAEPSKDFETVQIPGKIEQILKAL